MPLNPMAINPVDRRAGLERDWRRREQIVLERLTHMRYRRFISTQEAGQHLAVLDHLEALSLPWPPFCIARSVEVRFVGSIKKSLDPTIHFLRLDNREKIQLAIPPNPSDECGDLEGVVNIP
jgi:hypothetical protein